MKDLKKKILETNFEQLFKKLNYAYFTKGSYNLNIIGIRNTTDDRINEFDDFIVVDYKDSNGHWIRKLFSATTSPGLKSLKNLQNSKGCAILVPNQYRGCWIKGKHKGEYDALVQSKPVSVYRDFNKDSVLDKNKNSIDTGIFGINIHKAGKDSTDVDGWSAGCQVFKKSDDFDTFMKLVQKQLDNKLGTTFTYTLINDTDLK